MLKSGLDVEPDGRPNEQYGACGYHFDCCSYGLSTRVSPCAYEVTHVAHVSRCLLVMETEVSEGFLGPTLGCSVYDGFKFFFG